MSRFVKGQHVGERVRQGEVIGYVGMTGLATGPHLHYEFRVNGTQRNPQTVTLPKPQPLPAAQMALFKAQVVKPQLARLTELDARIKLAQARAPASHDNGVQSRRGHGLRARPRVAPRRSEERSVGNEWFRQDGLGWARIHIKK